MKPRAYFLIKLNSPDFCNKNLLFSNQDFILAKRYRDELYCYAPKLEAWRYFGSWDRGCKDIESCSVKEERQISQEEADRLIKHHELVEKLSR